MRHLAVTIAAVAFAIAIAPVSSVAEAPATAADRDRVTVWSGVSYRDLEVGTGAIVRPGQLLRLHATGWLSDGTKFWSSRDGDHGPLDMPLRGGKGGVIDGWMDGIPGMRVGGKRKLWVPAELGYGPSGFGSSIPPDSDLVFEIEVFAIVDK